MLPDRLSDKQRKNVGDIINSYRNDRLTGKQFVDRLAKVGLLPEEIAELVEFESEIKNL